MVFKDKKEHDRSKKVYIELLRIVAMFLVLFNHTDGYGLFVKGTDGEIGRLANMILTYQIRKGNS